MVEHVSRPRTVREYSEHGDGQGAQHGRSGERVEEWRIKRLYHEGFVGRFKDFGLYPIAGVQHDTVMVSLEFQKDYSGSVVVDEYNRDQEKRQKMVRELLWQSRKIIMQRHSKKGNNEHDTFVLLTLCLQDYHIQLHRLYIAKLLGMSSTQITI